MFKLILSKREFDEFTALAPSTVVADVETCGRTPGIDALLGVAIAWRQGSLISTCYIGFNLYNRNSKTLEPVDERKELAEAVGPFLKKRHLIGHNIEYDRKWIDASFGISSKWEADTRLMWHLTDQIQTQRGYGLKAAQKELLKWPESNDKELEESVKMLGGRLSNGDHYLAPFAILGKYACLDVKATLELYENRLPILKWHNYLPFYRRIQKYQKVVQQAADRGVDVDVKKLVENREKLVVNIGLLETEIRDLCSKEIKTLEIDWFKQDLDAYKTSRGLSKFIEDIEKHRKFNFKSNDQKALLFYNVLGLSAPEFTETGKPKTDKNTLAQLDHPVAKLFVQLSEQNKILQMIDSYLDSIYESKIQFGYNVAATVSGRLGGYKPYALNLPFDSKEAMGPFKVSNGYIGIHADLKSIEPCFIAAYSKDETLLKVHRDGLGDVYLDFARVAFPSNRALRELYNPMEPITNEIKKEFKKERAACKIVHLAVGYTGTSVTVAKSLTKAGFPTTEVEARRLVSQYWELFHKVKDFSERCKQLRESKKYFHNPFGRLLYVPRHFAKDTMNRLIQSAAHDCLMEWVLLIDKMRKEHCPEMRPVLIDCHDSTSWEVPKEHYEKAKWIFEEALRRISSRLNLGINLSCEIKPFSTFYGLKNDE
jgi:DNA polymerase I-like protein with 3'-5' exonuclease and polymerase domains